MESERRREFDGDTHASLGEQAHRRIDALLDRIELLTQDRDRYHDVVLDMERTTAELRMQLGVAAAEQEFDTVIPMGDATNQSVPVGGDFSGRLMNERDDARAERDAEILRYNAVAERAEKMVRSAEAERDEARAIQAGAERDRDAAYAARDAERSHAAMLSTALDEVLRFVGHKHCTTNCGGTTHVVHDSNSVAELVMTYASRYASGAVDEVTKSLRTRLDREIARVNEVVAESAELRRQLDVRDGIVASLRSALVSITNTLDNIDPTTGQEKSCNCGATSLLPRHTDPNCPYHGTDAA